MSAHAIETFGLGKTYGTVRALNDLNLTVEPGEIFGFLGPNGAGKTTTIRLLLDLIRPTSGRATVLGMDSRADSVAIKKVIGYLPGELALWDNLTGAETLAYFAQLRGGVEQGRIATLAQQFDLDLGKPFRTYSKGNKQKIGIIQAVMHHPRLLILDEPTSGLDPLNQQVFYALMRSIKGEGATTFLSSHVFGEVEHVCDRVGILRQGELVRVAALHELASEHARTLVARFTQPVRADAFATLANASVSLSADGLSVDITTQDDLAPVLAALSRLPLRDLATREPSLEEAFLKLYK